MNLSSGDSDSDTDQSTRVERRVAHGLYVLTHGEQDVGEEVWAIFAMRSGIFRCLTEIDQRWPVPHQQRAQLDVDEHWRVQALWAQVDVNAVRRMATYVPTEHRLSIEIVEVPLHEEDEHASRTAQNRLIANRAAEAGFGLSLPRAPVTPHQVGHPAGANRRVVRRSEVPFQPDMHLDYASTLFNFVAVQRLRLERGSQATFDSVVLTQPSLEPLSVRQTYAYVSDETITRNTNPVPVRRYTIRETGLPDLLTTFWTDEHGITLRQELLLAGLPYRCDMLNYRWNG
jgi:hypothetical protein